MPYLVAIERDPKCYKEIQENWSELAKELGHEVIAFSTMEDFNTEFSKPENVNKIILLLIVAAEEIKGDLVTGLSELKEKYKCNILLSMFDDPLKPLKKVSTFPVRNIIYKPFDLTILKEHTRFAIMSEKKIKTQFVHTTQVEATIESIKKFKMSQLSEFGFKIEKNYPLEKNKAYKFYHPLFANKKNQHAWARLLNETDTQYEMHFCQSVSVVLSQLRKKVASSKSKVNSPVWAGANANKQTALTIALQISDEAVANSTQELLTRNFKDLTFIANSDINPKQKISADVLITDVVYEENTLDAQFSKRPLIIRIYDDAPKRADLEKRFELEFIRIEKPLDRSFLVKVIYNLFPSLAENEEEIQKVTALIEDNISLSEVIKIQEFSEAAISFSDPHKYDLGLIMNIALPQDDEINLQEFKAKIHYVSEKPNPDKVYLYQFVLFGMKDQFLKNIRLWALQKHIEKNKAS
jgi:hypothetical protein